MQNQLFHLQSLNSLNTKIFFLKTRDVASPEILVKIG